LYGDCVLLALAIHAKADWEIVQIDEGPADDPTVRHVLVRMPGDALPDAAGPHTNYCGETPFETSGWGDIPDGMWRDQTVMADAEDLLSRVGAS
jgi:hypothetical protein